MLSTIEITPSRVAGFFGYFAVLSLVMLPAAVAFARRKTSRWFRTPTAHRRYTELVGLIAHFFVEWLRTGLGADLCWGVPRHDAPRDFRKRQTPPQTAKMKFFRHRLWSSQRSPLRAGIGCSRIHAPTATHVRRLSRAKPSRKRQMRT